MTISEREYVEQHWQNIEDIGVAFTDDRVWVCMNGRSLLRAKLWGGKLYIEFTPPEGDDNG